MAGNILLVSDAVAGRRARVVRPLIVGGKVGAARDTVDFHNTAFGLLAVGSVFLSLSQSDGSRDGCEQTYFCFGMQRHAVPGAQR